MDAVQSNLGGVKVKVCGLIQYLNLYGVAIGYTIAASISMMAIKRSNCFHESGGKNPCHMSSNPYMIMFGIAEIILSQIPDLDQIWWLAIVAAVMSFTCSSIGLGLGIAQVAANRTFKGSLTGISIGMVTQTQKIWRSFQALGDIAFAYSYSIILIEIQDTIKSPPSEAKTMKKATLISIAVATKWPNNQFITKETKIPIPVFGPYSLNLFRLVWRTSFVISTTVISMLLPFFNNIVGIVGALGFWPLTVYFPIEMYIAQKKVPRWSTRWICLQLLSISCLVISLAAAAGSVAGVILDLKVYKPFKTRY
ncbi:Amino acid permease 3 [Ancistrocladus abbreviatus]